MNIAKNMEAIFIIAVALIGATGLARAAVHEQAALVQQAAVQSGAAPMAVVTITAKRLSAAQKAALGN